MKTYILILKNQSEIVKMQCIDVYKWQVTNVRNSITSLFKQMNCTVGALLREFRKIFLLYIKKYFEGIRNCCFRQK